MVKLPGIILFFFLFFVLFAGSSSAASITLYPTQDTYINSASPNSSYANAQNLVSSLSQNNNTESSPLFKFSLAQIPAHATINSATLTLWQNNSANESTVNLSVTALTSDWNNAVAWANQPHNQGDYGSSQLEWDLTFKTWDMKSIVKAWLAGTIPNYGFSLKVPGLGVGSYNRTFSSSEDPQANRRPKLVIDYTEANVGAAAAPNINFRITPIQVHIGNLNTFIISDISAVGDFGSATVTWKTDKAANSIVYYGNAQDGTNRFDKQTGQNDSTTSHLVVLPGISPGTKYSYKVSSTVGDVQKFGDISFFTTLSEPAGDAYTNHMGESPSPTPTPTPAVDNPVASMKNDVENKVAEYVIRSSEPSSSHSGAENSSSSSAKTLSSSNPAVLVAGLVGTNRIAGIILLLIGFVSLIAAFVIFETGKRVHKHIKGRLQKGRK